MAYAEDQTPLIALNACPSNSKLNESWQLIIFHFLLGFQGLEFLSLPSVEGTDFTHF